VTVATHAVTSAHPVMPAKAGIHDLLCANETKPWIPAFAGMTCGVAPTPVPPPGGCNPRFPPNA